jgi:hypothetical protein
MTSLRATKAAVLKGPKGENLAADPPAPPSVLYRHRFAGVAKHSHRSTTPGQTLQNP